MDKNSAIGKKFMLKKRRTQPGATPGTLVIDKASPKPAIKVIGYSKDFVEERDFATFDEFDKYLNEKKSSISWIDVQGLGNESTLRRIAERFDIHPLALADVTNIPQQPKIENFGKQTFVISRMFRITQENQIESEQVSIFVGEDYLITFQEYYGDCLDPIRKRLRDGKGIIREMSTGYLAYAIFDTIVDNYFPVLEEMGERLERLEDLVIGKSTEEELKQLYSIKHELLELKRILWPSREVVSKMIRFDQSFIGPDVKVYLGDIYDHLIQGIDLVETYRELTTELMSIYLSALSNKMNEIMKVLTMIATIFIPLSFIVGMYGMNFVNIPELKLEYGYFVVLSVMGAVVAGMLIFFWKKKWVSFKKRE